MDTRRSLAMCLGTLAAPVMLLAGCSFPFESLRDLLEGGYSDVIYSDDCSGEDERPLPARTAIADDLDGDGDLDLALTGPSLPSVDFLPNRGDGTLGACCGLAEGVGRFDALAAGDLDGDGDTDFAVLFGGCGDSVIQVWINGGGTCLWSSRAGADLAGYTVALAVADVDGDDDQDLLVANEAARSETGSVDIVTNAGDATFHHAQRLRFDASPRAVVAADLDGDGDIDFAVTGDRVLWVSLNDGDGAFGPPNRFDSGSGGRRAIVGDADGDGDPDIVVTDDNGAALLRNRGDGAFDGPADLNIDAEGELTFALGDDFNDDGVLDLALATFTRVLVLINKGDGSFHAATSFDHEEVEFVTSGDFDGDGDPDVVAGNYFLASEPLGEILLLLNDGGGTFSTRVYLIGGGCPAPPSDS